MPSSRIDYLAQHGNSLETKTENENPLFDLLCGLHRRLLFCIGRVHAHRLQSTVPTALEHHSGQHNPAVRGLHCAGIPASHEQTGINETSEHTNFKNNVHRIDNSPVPLHLLHHHPNFLFLLR